MEACTRRSPISAHGLARGWVGHTGQLLGWESVVVYNTETGAAFVAIVNETGSLIAAEAIAAQLFPDLGDIKLL